MITNKDLKEWNKKIQSFRKDWRWRIRRTIEMDFHFSKFKNQNKTNWGYCEWGMEEQPSGKFSGVYVKYKGGRGYDFYSSIDSVLNFLDEDIEFLKGEIKRLKKVRNFIATKKQLIDENNAIENL